MTARRRRYRSKSQRFWKRYGPTIQFLLICAVLLAVVIFVAVKLVSAAAENFRPEETTVATETPTEKETEPPTEEPTENLADQPVGGVIYLTFDDGPGPQTPR